MRRKDRKVTDIHQAGRSVIFTEAQAETVCVFKMVSTQFTGKRKPMQ